MSGTAVPLPQATVRATEAAMELVDSIAGSRKELLAVTVEENDAGQGAQPPRSGPRSPRPRS
jgi:hypothetical protein